MLTWKYIGGLHIKGKHNFKHFYYIHIVEIPTKKGEHSWKCTELSFKRKEGITDLEWSRLFFSQCVHVHLYILLGVHEKTARENTAEKTAHEKTAHEKSINIQNSYK